jgi:hypothetical protein
MYTKYVYHYRSPNGSPDYILGLKKGIYILKISGISEKVKYKGKPFTYVLSKGRLKGDPLLLLLLLHSPQCQIIYLFFIRDRFSGEQILRLSSLMICDRCIDLTCQIHISYLCQWRIVGTSEGETYVLAH